MSDTQTLEKMLQLCRTRTLGSVARIEKLADPQAALAWRPGPGRAHVGWQLMHLAATDDRIVNQFMKGGQPKDPVLVAAFGGGSKPADDNVPTLQAITEKLASYRSETLQFLNEADLQHRFEIPNRGEFSTFEWFQTMAWHESHHQGQIHLTLNLYEAQNG